MQPGDYTSAPYYHHYNPTAAPNPNPPPAPSDQHPAPYASAPPFSTPAYAPADYANYPSNYSPYHQNQDPVSPPNLHPPTSFTASPSQPPPAAPASFPGFESHGAYQPPPPQQPHQSYYDPPPAAPPSYPAPNLSSNSMPAPNPSSSNPPPYSSMYPSSAPYNPPSYDSSYPKFDHGVGGAYFDDRYGNYGRGKSSSGSELYGKQSDASSLYDSVRDDSYGDGVYAYQGGKSEPYGARGTAPKSSTWSAFDDYGRSISLPSSKESSSVSSPKIVRAVPKAEEQQDAKSGVQKFRVKLLPETGSQSMDVLCQISLDGITMLDPSTSRMLRIYPLENITRCEVLDSTIFAFWSKTNVDIEPRRIRLQSNRYTTNTILDIVTAATVQLKEMGGRSRPSDAQKLNERPAEKKKGFADWINRIKPGNEEKDHWVPDEAVTKCTACAADFGAFNRRHHCRNCGDIFCDKCTNGRIALTADEDAQPVRVCDRCMAEVTQRLSNAKEAANRPATVSHEDLAKKLKEEMERNRRARSGSKSEGSGGRRMREVACPICTVHLQVQVPSSGSETIECGVCQHPFLVSAH